MSEYVDFHYMPLEGKITGKQVLKQTEDAINDLGNKVYSLDIDESRIDEAIENSEQAIETADSALSAVTTDRAVWKNTVAEMKATDIDLSVTAATRGKMVFNDGNGAFYGVRSEKSGDVESDDTVFLDNGNVAERIQSMNIIAKGNNIIFVANVAELIDSDALIGNVYGTTGYYSANDGGAGLYSIRSKTQSDVENGGSIIFLYNGNVAELITDNAIAIPEQFGAYGDGTHDDTTAIQNAINSLNRGAGGQVLFGSKTYRCESGITFDKSIVFKGVNKERSKLYYVGGSLFINQTYGDVLGFEDICLLGNGSSTGTIAVAGSICYQSYNNAYSQNSKFMFWETVSEWSGGYYHRHSNSHFRYNKIIFDNYNQNGLDFFGCSFATFEKGIVVTSGEGPVTFVGGAVEKCAGYFITTKNGRAVCANIIGTYFEQYASESCPEGINSSTGKFDVGVGIYTNGTQEYAINIIGCILWADWFRFMYYDTTNGGEFNAIGNTIIVRSGSVPSTFNRLYSLNSKVKCHIKDIIDGDGTLPSGFASYAYGYPADLQGCYIYDPINKKDVEAVLTWSNLTLINGWAGDTTSKPQYSKDKNGIVRFRGNLISTNATNGICANMPSGFKPDTAYISEYPIGTTNHSVLTASVYTSGVVKINGTLPISGEVILDAISYKAAQ